MRTAIAILLFLPAAADAATIEVVTLPGKQLYRSVITVTGRINDGNHRTFREKAESAARTRQPFAARIIAWSPNGISHCIQGG